MRTGTITTATIEVAADLVTNVVTTGGYTHRLFHPEDAQDRPLPGQGVLLFMGGLVEQSGVLDHAVALLEIRSARFLAMVRPGDRLRVEVTAGTAEDPRGGRYRQSFTWTARKENDEIAATAEILMLLNEKGA